MILPNQLTLADQPRKKAIVFSHERSGTHFLMNTLEMNFGYIASPWVNLDLELGVHFYSPAVFRQMFQQFHDKPVLNVFKSHHPFDFVEDFIEYLAEQFHIFYVYRDPRDVMVSFWRILQNYGWDRGPKTATVGEFIRAEPLGDILRYQKRQMSSVLHRWESHVEGWTDCAGRFDEDKFIPVYYGDLDNSFETTVKAIGKLIGRPVDTVRRPDKANNVFLPGKGGSSHQEVFTAEDYEFVRQISGETMERLGIPWNNI